MPSGPLQKSYQLVALTAKLMMGETLADLQSIEQDQCTQPSRIYSTAKTVYWSPKSSAD